MVAILLYAVAGMYGLMILAFLVTIVGSNIQNHDHPRHPFLYYTICLLGSILWPISVACVVIDGMFTLSTCYHHHQNKNRE